MAQRCQTPPMTTLYFQSVFSTDSLFHCHLCFQHCSHSTLSVVIALSLCGGDECLLWYQHGPFSKMNTSVLVLAPYIKLVVILQVKSIAILNHVKISVHVHSAILIPVCSVSIVRGRSETEQLSRNTWGRSSTKRSTLGIQRTTSFMWLTTLRLENHGKRFNLKMTEKSLAKKRSVCVCVCVCLCA